MKVYKYTPHINLFLKSSSLKLTPSFQLNDPFEAKLTDEYISNTKLEMDKLLKNNKLTEGFAKNLSNNGKYKGIISLSMKKCDIKMLSHYAENHSGGILEFTIEDIGDGIDNKTSLFNGRSKSYNFGSVEYLSERNKSGSLDPDYFSKGFCFEKFIDWDEEEEVRYLSDFRDVDYLLIPKKELVEYYVENFQKRLNEHCFDYELYDFQVENDEFRYIYKYCGFEEKKGKFFFSKPKKIRSIVGKIFGKNIKVYKETDSMIEILIKDSNKSYYPFDRAYCWDRLIETGCLFHPMLKVEPSKLTGLYLGSKFDFDTFDTALLDKFENLNRNVKSALISPNDFSHELIDVL